MSYRASRIHALFPLALLALCGETSAQGGSGPLDVIVVTSSRVPLPLRSVATSMTVITRNDIAAHGQLALSEILRQQSSVAASNSGGPGQPTVLRIRGEESFRTLTIVDGIRISDPSGTQLAPQLEQVLSAGIGRVEILRGPQGLAYGADAGGVINISSHDPMQGIHGSLDVQGGKFGSSQYSLDAGAANARGEFALGFTDFSTGGFNVRKSDTTLRDADGYDNTTLHLRGSLALAGSLRLDLVHRRVDGDSLFDGCFDQTFAPSDACRALFDMNASRAALSYAGTAFSHSLAYANTRTERDSLAAGMSSFRAEGELQRWEYLGSTAALPGFRLVFGADLEDARNNGSSRDNTGIFAEYLSDFSERLHLTAGIRYDDNDDFGTNTNERISAAWLFSLPEGVVLKLKGSYGTGFRAPSPYEIAYNASPAAAPPATLHPLAQERSRGHELGIEYVAGDVLHLEAVYFDQEITDAIVFDLAGFSGYLQDFGTGISRGIELSARYRLNANWRLHANFTHNDSTQASGLPRLRRPQELLNLGIAYVTSDERLSMNAFMRASRKSVDQSGAQLLALDDFAVSDLSVRYAVSERLQVHGRIENIFDAEYEEVLGYYTPGRAAYLGFRLAFGDP